MSFIFGSKQKGKQDQRIGNVKERETGTNEAARVVPVIWGFHKLGGTYISDIFNQIAEPIQETYKAGKKKKTVTTGYNYKGSFAQLICMGPITSITGIYSNDELIWDGRINLDNVPSGKASIMTKVGQFHIYFGTATQNSDPILNHNLNYRHFCYFVAEDIEFGQNPNPGNFSFRIYRGDFNIDLPPPNVNYVVHDLLVNKVYGLGLPEELFEGTDDEVYVSPILDRNTTFRQFMGELLPYSNSALIYRNNKIYYVVERYTDNVSEVFTIENITEEPEIEYQSWTQTFSETRVNFIDIGTDFNDNVATFSDPANAQIQGLIVQKQFSRPFIRSASEAFLQAYSIGKMGGIPKIAVRLKVFSTIELNPSDKIFLNYPVLGITNKAFRIRSITVGTPLQPGLTIEADEDLTYLLGNEYEPTVDPIPTPIDNSPQDAFMRIGALPPLLRNSDDGILVCAKRPHGLITGASIYAGWDSSSYVFLNEFTTYPLQLEINRWRRFGAINILLDVTVASDFENNTLIAFRDASPELYMVFGIRKQELYASLDQHQVTPAWVKLKFNGRFVAVASRRWEIEVELGIFGSDAISLENFLTPTNGYFPTQIAFIGREGDFWTMPTNSLKFLALGGNDESDTDQKRFVQVITSTFDAEQDLGDGSILYYDRDDNTMSPEGTFEEDWGPRIPNKEHLSEVMSDLPVLYFRLNESTGSSAFDYTGHSHNALISSSGITFGQTTPILLDPFDKAIAFNNGSLTVSDHTDLDFGTEMTICFWIKTVQNTEGFLISKHEEELSGFEVSLLAGKIRFHIHHGSGPAPQYSVLTSTNSINNNQWHHIALRFDSELMTLLVDGVIDSATLTAPVTTIPANSIDLTIGQRDTALLPFIGILDEIAFFDSIISESRILAHYNSGIGVSW